MRSNASRHFWSETIRVPLQIMKLLFWLSLGAVSYTYFGYVVLLAVYARLRRRPLVQREIVPSVSILIAAHNEERQLPAKLSNLESLLYPGDRLQILISSDGSTDHTPEILREHAARVIPIILDQPRGKAGALNEAARRATGEILVFLDVRQMIDANAVSELVACFADPEVGAVSGELLLEPTAGGAGNDGLGIYWKIEKAVRKLESESGSVVGVTGAIYAIRRELFAEIPDGTILDDVFVPMNVARQGRRVVFQPSAIARDRIFVERGKEFSRKVRTLTGNYQLVQLAPWLLSPANPLLFRFVSHKLLRLLVPFFLLLMAVTSALSGGPFYRMAFGVQLLCYGLAALGAVRPSTRRVKPIAISYTFVLLNLAAAAAFSNFMQGRNKVWCLL
jgi:poly-beta-1,6-N-acetyl-D-glucosamine synthase